MKHLLSCILIIFCLSVNAQQFQGVVTYNNTYISRIGNPNSEKLAELMGSKQEYFYKNGNYKIVTNGTVAEWQMYTNKDNKLYYKMKGSNEIQWNDAASNDDSIIKIEIHKNAAVVLGYNCDEMTVTTKSGTQKYYYNPKFAINPVLFSRHKFGNWNEYIKRAKSLPLKIIIENSQFTLENVATEIKEIPLDDKYFLLPDNASIKKTPF